VTDEEKQALNEKLARWAGFTYKHCQSPLWTYERYKETSDWWEAPRGSRYLECPRFTDSLDACFKWLVPKLVEEGWLARVQFGPHLQRDFKTRHVCAYVLLSKPYSQADYDATAESPALALCLAIEKLIDAEATK
jgi:hypothetical protein